MAVERNTFENIFGKVENADDQYLSFSHNLFFLSQSKVQTICYTYFAGHKSFQSWCISNFVVW